MVTSCNATLRCSKRRSPPQSPPESSCPPPSSFLFIPLPWRRTSPPVQPFLLRNTSCRSRRPRRFRRKSVPPRLISAMLLGMFAMRPGTSRRGLLQPVNRHGFKTISFLYHPRLLALCCRSFEFVSRSGCFHGSPPCARQHRRRAAESKLQETPEESADVGLVAQLRRC